MKRWLNEFAATYWSYVEAVTCINKLSQHIVAKLNWFLYYNLPCFVILLSEHGIIIMKKSDWDFYIAVCFDAF